MMETEVVKVVMFNETREVPKRIVEHGPAKKPDEPYDEVLWIERGEDWYALSNMKGRIQIVERAVWLSSPIVEE